MRKGILILTALIGAALLVFTGCNKAGNEEKGRLIVKITDEAFPIDFIEDASVTITKVEMRADAERNGEEGTEGSPFLTLFEGAETFNLANLRNGMMAAFLDLEIPAGYYNLIRIYVDNASITVKDHETYSVKVPSGSQTGVKVFIKPSLNVAGGLTSEVILDFSLDKSFVLKGNMDTPAGIDGFNFKPVIRAVNNTVAGTVQGTVQDTSDLPLSDVAVAIMQEEVISTAYTDEEGFYALPGILAGIYTLTAEAEGFVSDTVTGLKVVEGNATIQNFALVPEEEESK